MCATVSSRGGRHHSTGWKGFEVPQHVTAALPVTNLRRAGADVCRTTAALGMAVA